LTEIVEIFKTKELPNLVAKVLVHTEGKPCDRWSLGNKLIMVAHGTTDARTYQQWQEVGRFPVGSVKCADCGLVVPSKFVPQTMKCTKCGGRLKRIAFHILAPVRIPVCPKCSRKPTGKDAAFCTECGEKIAQKLVGFRACPYPMFAAENTAGRPLPVYQPRKLPPLFEVAKRWGLFVKYERMAIGYGAFSSGNSTITLATENENDFWHELGHAAHAQIEKLKPGQVPEQEAVAELTAATLSRLYRNDAYVCEAWNYLAHYAENRTPEAVGKLCMRVLAKVAKVLELILDQANSPPQQVYQPTLVQAPQPNARTSSLLSR